MSKYSFSKHNLNEIFLKEDTSFSLSINLNRIPSAILGMSENNIRLL